MTASGLTEDWHNVEANRYRTGEPFRANHFGMIDIDWSQPDPAISLQIIDGEGLARIQHQIALSELD